MIGFSINMMMFAVNIFLGMMWGFTEWTYVALLISFVGAMACLAIENSY